MYNEARNRPDEATAWYEKILEDGSADQATLRRQIGAVKGAEGPSPAIAKLVKHLEVFQNDLTCWEELAELYVQVCKTEHLDTDPKTYIPAHYPLPMLYCGCQWLLQLVPTELAAAE